MTAAAWRATIAGSVVRSSTLTAVPGALARPPRPSQVTEYAAGGSMTPSSALCGPQSSRRLRPAAGLRRAEGTPAPTTPSSALCGLPSGSRLRPVAELRGGLAGIRQHRDHLLHSAGRRPAAGFCRLQGCCARGPRRLRRHHVLHPAGRRPAAGSGRLPGCYALGSRRLQRQCSAMCEPPSASAGCWRVPRTIWPLAPEPDHNLPFVHTIHLIGPTPTLLALCAESILIPVGPLSFLLRP